MFKRKSDNEQPEHNMNTEIQFLQQLECSKMKKKDEEILKEKQPINRM